MSDKPEIAQHDVWQRYRHQQCQQARQQLVEIHARIVKYVAGRMAIGLPHYVDFNDLVSAGLLGLIQAIDNFDHERGIKFETYAIPRIRGAILDELRSQDWFPRSLRRKAKQLEETYATLEARLGRPATDQEVADALQIDVRDLDNMLGEVAVATIMSLDADASSDESDQSTSLGDYVADPHAEDMERVIAAREMRDLIAHRMSELPEKEQLVLVLYYYEELTLKEIGEILDVTESRVCQIHTKAIMRLRSKIERHEGKSSIGRLQAEIERGRKTPRDVEPAPVRETVDITACLMAAPLAGALLASMLGVPVI
ncbi:FliA/WhiG family RNA polymerase sigma factor [bacterium]|nr:FliA/WhiG family RNA polymerase sigma factor [bacterium]